MSSNKSMTELAESVGVSKMTISLYLRDPQTKRVSEKLKKKIQAAMKDNNYTPPLDTQFNKKGKTKIIAVLIPFNLSIFKYEQVNEILGGIQEELFHNGYSMIFIKSNIENGKSVIDTECVLKCRSFDGVILFGTRFSRIDQLHKNIIILKENKIPFVTVNIPNLDEDINQIICTNTDDCSPTNYLLSLNHKNIVLLGGSPEAPDTSSAIEEYTKSLTEHGVPINKDMIINGGYETISAYHALSELLNKGIKISAIYSLSMLMTAGVYRLLKERGLSVPKDISVVGQGDYYYSDILDPSLTAVHLPLEESGKRSVQLLLDVVHHENGAASKVFLANQLVLRQSTGRKI